MSTIAIQLLTQEVNHCANSRDYEKALELCAQMLELDPERVDTYINQGVMLRKLGRHAEARTSFMQALERQALDNHSLRKLLEIELKRLS